MSRCINHPINLDGFMGTAYCQECGEMIYGQLKLCERCSKYLDKCEICCAAAESDINPALVKAYNSEEAAKARYLRRTAMEVQTGPYADALRDVYQKLTDPALKAYEEAVKAKLAADFAKDSAYQNAMKVYDAARALPKSEANDQALNEAVEALSAACKPHLELMDHSKTPLLANYHAALVPFQTVHDAVWGALTQATAKMIADADATLEKILADARNASKA